MFIYILSVILLISGLIHIIIGFLNAKVKSPFGSGRKAHVLYGSILASISFGIYLLRYVIGGSI